MGMGWDPLVLHPLPVPHVGAVAEAVGDVDGRMGSVGVARCVRLTSMCTPGPGVADLSAAVPWAAALTPMDRGMGEGVGEAHLGSEAWGDAVRRGGVPRVDRAPHRCSGCGACVSPFCEERGRGLGSPRGRWFVDMACPMCGKATRVDGVEAAESLVETQCCIVDYVPSPSSSSSFKGDARLLRETVVFVVDETLDGDQMRGAQEAILECVREIAEGAVDSVERAPRIALVTAGRDVSVYEVGGLKSAAEPRRDTIRALDPESVGRHKHPLGSLDWGHVEGVLYDGGAVHAGALPKALPAFEVAVGSIPQWNHGELGEEKGQEGRPRCLAAAIEVAVALCAGGRHASRWANGFESALTVADPRKRCFGGSVLVLASGPCNAGAGAVPVDTADVINYEAFASREKVASHMAGIASRANRAGVSIHIFGTGLCPLGVTALEPLCGGTGGRIILADTFTSGEGDNAVTECFGRNLRGVLRGRFGCRAGVQLRHSRGIKICPDAVGGLGDPAALPAAREFFLEDRHTPPPAARYSCLGGAAREDACFTLFFEADESRGRSLASRLLGPLVMAGVDVTDEDGSGERTRPREFVQIEAVLILPSGRRVLRVITLALPWAETPKEFLAAQDVHALVVALAKTIVVADREAALQRMEMASTGFHGRVGDPESAEAVGRMLRDIALAFDGHARGGGFAEKLLRIRQGGGAKAGPYACLPPLLEMLPGALWHLCHGPLLGVLAQHADQVEELRTCLLLANVHDALLMVEPVCECVVRGAEGGSLGLRRVAPDSLTLRSDRVVLLDAGTDMMLWVGRNALDDADSIDCAKGAALARVQAQGRWPAPRLRVVREGDGQARYVTSRLNPAHQDAAEDQEVWHPDLSALDEDERLDLVRSMPPTDDVSILGWLRSLRVHVPRTDTPSRASHVRAVHAAASAVPDALPPPPPPGHMVMERASSPARSGKPAPAARPAVFV